MKMIMYLKYRDGRPQEKREYNTKAECDTHYNFIRKYRNHEIESVKRGPVNNWAKAETIVVQREMEV